MAAVRSMMSVVREEAAVVTAELAATARTSAIEATRTAEIEVNPTVVRQAVKASVKESTVAEPSLLASHLAHAPPVNPGQTTALIAETMPGPNAILGESTSIIGKAIERETGIASFRDALSNATQTGAEEQVDDMMDLAKALLDNPEVKAQMQQATAGA